MKTVCLIALMWFFWLDAVLASSLAPELWSFLKHADPDNKISVIIRFADKVDYQKFDHITGAKASSSDKIIRGQLIRSLKENSCQTRAAMADLLQFHRVENVRHLWAINALALEADTRLIEEMSNNPEIERIDPDVAVSLPQPVSPQQSVSQWNLNMIGAPDVWELGYTGQGVVIAVMDTGVDAQHPDLSKQWRGGNNSWFDPFGVYDQPHDPIGHGTQVAGIAVGGDSSGFAIGVAPGAQWIAVRIYDNDGSSTYSIIHAGFQWLLDPDGNPDTDDTPDVVNNSWGLVEALDKCVMEFEEDVRVLTRAGIVVVCSSGNTGPNEATSISPSNYADCISVGSVDDTEEVSDFSGRGPSSCGQDVYPTFTAPGEFIHTADLTLGGVGDPYVEVSGTSYAAAHVTGAMALLMGAHPEATLSDLKLTLSDGAKDLGDSGPDHQYGYGRIDLPASLELLQNNSDNDSGGGDSGCFITAINEKR